MSMQNLNVNNESYMSQTAEDCKDGTSKCCSGYPTNYPSSTVEILSEVNSSALKIGDENEFIPKSNEDSSENTKNQEQVNIVGQNVEQLSVSFATSSNNATLQVVAPSTGGNTTGLVRGSSTSSNTGADTIYLLVSGDSPTPVLQPVIRQNVPSSNNDEVNAITAGNSNFKPVDTNIIQPGTSIVQVMNSNGVPVNLNVNDLLDSISNNKESKKDPPEMLNLSSSIISTIDNTNCSVLPVLEKTDASVQSQNINVVQFVINSVPSFQNQLPNVPNWALHLRDCILYGDTYTGYVNNENELDTVLNLYKKETQSLFAIRQTPSPAKDESADTVRLMWKSQYVPYDGIPFANVGRRATVMECEHGPRKRSNALKRMAQMHGHKSDNKTILNLTCPARLFVKKVKKFTQYRVPLDAGRKLERVLQERSLKLIRQNGTQNGEIRLYMQLPLPSAHKYHHIGNSYEVFEKEIQNLEDVMLDTASVDSRVLGKAQELVRQGFINPFVVRAGMKEFVEKKMKLNPNEEKPYKHNKQFYPTLIEVQNIIQQTKTAIESGLLTQLPKPDTPTIQDRPKRKKKSTAEDDVDTLNPEQQLQQQSPLVIKRLKFDIPIEDANNIDESRLKIEATKDSPHQTETIALTLTDSQLENFSVTNFTYDQLAQLAKIGLLALNNATKDGEQNHQQHQPQTLTVNNESIHTTNTTDTMIHETIRTDNGENILVVTPNNLDEDGARLRLLTGTTEHSVLEGGRIKREISVTNDT